MIYCIGCFRQIDGSFELELCKKGNGYYLGLENTETKEYLTRDFNNLDEAIKTFNKMVEILIKHYGNDTYKKNMFLTYGKFD